MEHQNYCRSLLRELIGYSTPDSIQSAFMNLARESVKFQLPEDGRLLDDNELRALGDDLPLSLPFDVVALEVQGRKIVFVQQTAENLVINVANYIGQGGLGWLLHETTWSIPRNEYIDRKVDGYLGFPGLRMHDSDCGWLDSSNSYWFQRVILGFLNALSCSNVKIEKSYQNKSGKKIKPALPFDTYHILTIRLPQNSSVSTCPTGSHRAPREHLRRGHIRRLSDGRRIWVSATVVSVGNGSSVAKDYAIRPANVTVSR